ncbi:MAG: peptide synthase, partial [Pirellulales bacterium]
AAIHPDGEVYTPYGATEALPVASMAASDVLTSTWEQTERGGGVCVGRRFPAIEWKVIRPVDGPVATIAEIDELPRGEIGELIVRGPQVTRRYVTRLEWNARSKIADGDTLWHRMGDLGYFDDVGRFWFCGRMNHRVQTADGPLDTIRCEAIFNRHPDVRRTALVGIGGGEDQTPALVIEPVQWRQLRGARRGQLVRELGELAAGCEHTRRIEHFLFRRTLPVDVRHNAKIFREELAVWAERRLVAG